MSWPLTKYRFSIFNRWGQKVFETTDQTRGWDGKFNDRLSGNVYTWVCTYQYEGQQVVVTKGIVAVIR
jgi:gliding motility-associated-like protein